ncbi:MAG: hypothetical protein AAF085_03740 [Planctomycetota bacterium]
MTDQYPRLDDATRAELEDYMDGRMTAEQRAAFQQRIEDDPVLAAEFKLQQRVDDAIGRLHAADMQRVASTRDAMLDRLRQGSPAEMTEPVKASRSPVFRWAAFGGIAAVIALAAILLFSSIGPNDSYEDMQFVEVATVYQDEVEAGFAPDWVCDNQRFTETIQEKLGRTVALSPMPDDRRMLGLSYVPRARQDSVVMLGQYSDQDVLVFFDLAELADEFYALEVNDGLYVHQRDLGDLRMIEVSPEEMPVFLDYVSRPDLEPDSD